MDEIFVICYFDPLSRSLWRKEKKETNLAYYRGWMDGWMVGWLVGWMDGWMDGDGRTDG